MASWKTAYRSFYYATADEPDDIELDPKHTANGCNAESWTDCEAELDEVVMKMNDLVPGAVFGPYMRSSEHAWITLENF